MHMHAHKRRKHVAGERREQSERTILVAELSPLAAAMRAATQSLYFAYWAELNTGLLPLPISGMLWQDTREFGAK